MDIDKFLDERDKIICLAAGLISAREQKDYALSDHIRQQIVDAGWIVGISAHRVVVRLAGLHYLALRIAGVPLECTEIQIIKSDHICSRSGQLAHSCHEWQCYWDDLRHKKSPHD